MKRLLRIGLLTSTSLIASSAVGAQILDPGTPVPASHPWMDDVGYGVVNAVIAGVGAGVVHRVRGGRFRDAFMHGSLGGALQYGGRRLAAAKYDGAGLVGRSVHAVGASASRAAAEGLPTFDRILIPAGPLWLEWKRPEGSIDVTVDAQGAYWLAFAVVQDHLDLDLARSLSAGTFVFTSTAALSSHDPAVGRLLGSEAGGVVVLRADLDTRTMAEAYAHERVHVLQRDASFALLSEPLDSFLAERAGSVGAGLTRHVHWGLSDLLWDPVFHGPREAEALFLGARE